MISGHHAVEERDESLGHLSATQRAIQLADNPSGTTAGFDIGCEDALYESGLQGGRCAFPAGIAEQHVELLPRVDVVEEVPADGMAWARNGRSLDVWAKVDGRRH